jgi:hypothetical protein
MEKFMIDEGLDRALDIIHMRIEYYKKEDGLINAAIIKELESVAREIKAQKYYK